MSARTARCPTCGPTARARSRWSITYGKPARVDTIVISTQHSPDVEHSKIEADLYEQVIKYVVPNGYLDKNTKIYINPTGRFVVGGPMGDSGLTGRKIIVDTYGGVARHGGGAFSGKDPTKVDRSAAYMARYVAKNLVAAGVAERLEIQVSYAIGVAHPLSVAVETFGTGKISDERDRRTHPRVLRPAPGCDHPRPEPAPADLPGDCGLRSLRPPRHRRTVGEPGQGRRAAGGRRSVGAGLVPARQGSCAGPPRARSETGPSEPRVAPAGL